MQVRAMVESGLRALMPEISRIGANMTCEVKNRITAINIKSVKLIFIAGVTLYLGVFIFADIFLKIWLGDRFVAVLPNTFRILLALL